MSDKKNPKGIRSLWQNRKTLAEQRNAKSDAYSFLPRVLEGTVEYISGDAIEDERLGLVYKLVISLNNNTLHKGGEDYKIVPGMAVVAEVKTGTRRVLDFFTEPLTRGIDNSLRKR